MAYLSVVTTPTCVKPSSNMSTLQAISNTKENIMKRMNSLYKSLIFLNLSVLPSASRIELATCRPFCLYIVKLVLTNSQERLLLNNRLVAMGENFTIYCFH